jgi:hypothetical protein
MSAHVCDGVPAYVCGCPRSDVCGRPRALVSAVRSRPRTVCERVHDRRHADEFTAVDQLV